jgi:hypothetical protein
MSRAGGNTVGLYVWRPSLISQYSHTRSAPPKTIGDTPNAIVPQNKASLKTSRLRCMAVPFMVASLRLRLVQRAQPGKDSLIVHLSSEVSLGGLCGKRLALAARRCSPGLVAQTNSRSCQSIFETLSLLDTTTLHARLHPLEDWRERDWRSHHRKLPLDGAVMAARCALIPRNTTAKKQVSDC